MTEVPYFWLNYSFKVGCGLLPHLKTTPLRGSLLILCQPAANACMNVCLINMALQAFRPEQIFFAYWSSGQLIQPCQQVVLSNHSVFCVFLVQLWLQTLPHLSVADICLKTKHNKVNLKDTYFFYYSYFCYHNDSSSLHWLLHSKMSVHTMFSSVIVKLWAHQVKFL